MVIPALARAGITTEPNLEICALHCKARSTILDLIWTVKLVPPCLKGRLTALEGS